MIMAMFPDIQEKAQAELDHVVGTERLPDFTDRRSLPYVNAVLKEIMRWHTIAPIGVGHRSVADDVYAGFRIPGGSLLIPNIWYVVGVNIRTGVVGRTKRYLP